MDDVGCHTHRVRCAPEDEESDRDERTLDVVFWLAPVAAGAAIVVPLLIGAAGLLGVDASTSFVFLIIGVPAIATVGLGVRDARRGRRGDGPST